MLAKAKHDPTATVRYAGLYGAGLVDMGQYKEAFTPLNEVLKLAQETPSVAYSTIAVDAKMRPSQVFLRVSKAFSLRTRPFSDSRQLLTMTKRGRCTQTTR